MKGGLFRLLISVFCLIGLVVAAVVLYQHDIRVMLIIVLLLIVRIIFAIVRNYRRYSENLYFLIKAIENEELSFNFNEGFSSQYDRQTNKYLNKIKHLILRIRQEAIDREKYYETILDRVNNGIIITNTQNSVIQCNSAALKLLGIHKLLHLNNLVYVAEGIEVKMKSLLPNASCTITLQNEKETININIRLSVVEYGKRTYKVFLLNNISNELEQAEIESWSRLTRVLTHEIMNSISPIVSISDAIMTTDNPEHIKEGLSVINSTSKTLIKFVENYRSVSRVPNPVMKAFNVRNLFDNCKLLYSTDKYPNISIQCTITPDNLLIYADETLIFQILSNLVKNGIESIGTDTGEIQMNAYCKENGETLIEVYDTGAPIPREVAEQIFVPFFTTKDSGSGIGLSLSRQIMKLHNGTISLIQTKEKKGFVLFFR